MYGNVYGACGAVGTAVWAAISGWPVAAAAWAAGPYSGRIDTTAANTANASYVNMIQDRFLSKNVELFRNTK